MERHMSVSGRVRWLVGVALALSVLSVGVGHADDQRRFGDVEVLARVPTPPGFPEGIAVFGNVFWVTGPATFGTAGLPPSKALLYHVETGALLRSYDIRGEDLSQEHANVGVAVDRAGRAYVLNTQLGVVRVSLTGSQERYATFPDLKPCAETPAGRPCSPTPFDAPAIPNDIVFDGEGNAYVTDSTQATIWRVPPGGGVARIWFQDVRLASTSFGPNGIRLSPDRTKVYFVVTDDLQGRARVYTLPFVPRPSAAGLKVFHEYGDEEIPDGIAFGATGRLYVAIATPFASGISILSRSGAEVVRLHNPRNPTFPYDSPANIAFDGEGSILVTNHAFATAIPEHFTVLDVFVNDPGSPLELPTLR